MFMSVKSANFFPSDTLTRTVQLGFYLSQCGYMQCVFEFGQGKFSLLYLCIWVSTVYAANHISRFFIYKNHENK